MIEAESNEPIKAESRKRKKQTERYVKLSDSTSMRPRGEKDAVSSVVGRKQIQVVFCTIGMLELISKELPKITKLLVDESGRIPWSALIAMITQLKNLEKLFVTGDVLQLPPFCGNLIPALSHFGMESVLDLLEELQNTEEIRLSINYRSAPMIVYGLRTIYPSIRAGCSVESRSLLTRFEGFNLPSRDTNFIFARRTT